MRSTVNLAVLGLVIERPSYGYELSQRFGSRFGGLLEVGRSHIYAALDSLQRDGLIEPLPPSPDEQPRQRKVHYRATPDGASAYRAGVAEQLHENGRQARTLARLAAIGGSRTETIGLLVDGYEREEEAAASGDDDGGAGSDAELLVTRLLREERRVMREAQRAWATFARAELAAFDDRAAAETS